jgi:tryptophanyl-tRNA synthetase
MEVAMKRLFSGIQPTGSLHIGNYLGAIKNWVSLQTEYDALYCIVDLHAITVDYDPTTLQDRIRELATVLLACGIDAPDKATLFVQSHVPEHSELTWFLNTVTPMAELQRMTQFKSKAQQHVKNINVSLFDYPVLQAADILLYKGQAVPVGEDQVQHIELSRIIARKFNNRFGDVFPEPWEKISYAKRIKGLDGQSKMSKSLDNQIDLVDEPQTIWDKLRPAFTDPARQRKSDPGTPEICNIHDLHTYFSSAEEITWCEEGCRSAGIGCFQCKRVLADNMATEFAPLRSKIASLREQPEIVTDILTSGAERARSIAQETMREVKGTMGLL